MNLRNYCLVFLLILCISGYSREIRQISGQRFEFFNIEYQTRILFFDSRGYLWIGTSNGVVQYDGYTFRHTRENPMDSTGFKGTVVYSIAEDHNGGIWAGTNTGLNYRAPGERNFINVPHESGPVYSIIETEDHILWLSLGNTLTGSTIENGFSEKYRINLPDAAMHLDKLFTTGNGQFLGIGKGCFEINYTMAGTPLVKPVIEDVYLKDIIQLADSRILIPSDTLLYILDGNCEILEKTPLQMNSSRLTLHSDRNGFLWAGTDRGFYKVEIGNDLKPVRAESYNAGRIFDIAEDRSGNLYFASRNEGIYKLGWNHTRYTYISLPPGFENTYAFKFLEDRKGNYWIGTDHGLLYYDSKIREFNVYLPEQGNSASLPHRAIYSLFEDREENIWAGTGNGVARYDKQSDSFHRIDVNGLSHHITQARDGTLWFDSEDRIYSIDPENLEVSSHEYIRGQKETISQIYIDSDNILWGWNIDNGLQYYSIEEGKPELLGHFTHPDVYQGYWVNWILEDDYGRLWISQPIGVTVVDKKSGKLVNYFNSTNSPLQQDDVFELVKDRTGHIWLKQHAHGSISIDPVTFSVASFNPVWLYNTAGKEYSCVVATGRDGKLFTDGTGEFCIFYPDSARINRVPPNVNLEALKVNGQAASMTDLRLRHDENNLNFAYCGLQFDNPEKNRYRFYLEGYDRDWVDAGFSRQALYSALPPGKYTFRVNACNSDGIWSKPVQLSSMTILRPWYSSIPALIIYVLILSAVILIIYNLQLRRKLALNELQKMNEIDDFKNRFFADISHEFRTPLTVISGLSENIEGKQGKLIRRNTNQILTLVDQILELSKIEAHAVEVKNEKLDIIAISRYILYSFSSLSEEKSLDMQFASDTDSLQVEIDREKYNTILQNLLSNAIKFTPAHGRVTVEIKNSGRQFELIVSDTGSGISKEDLPNIFNRYYQAGDPDSVPKGTGIGLALTRQLVELMNGRIEVSSKPGEGSSFRVMLPAGTPEPPATKQEDRKERRDIPDRTEERVQVLLIEDNIDVCIVVRDLLKADYEVFTADNGDDGVSMALNNIPDIIISDVRMPGRDGLELTQVLKKDSRTSHIPIILLTARADIESRLEGLSFGADVYLQKPFNNRELLLNIQNLLQLREAMRARYGDEEFTGTDPGNPEDKFITSLRDLIFKNLSDDSFGISQICRDIGVSRTQLHRKLTALTGKSVSLFVRDIRLTEGRKMIRNNGGNIAEIAYASGFKDPNYFTRLYTEKYGYPPTRERS